MLIERSPEDVSRAPAPASLAPEIVLSARPGAGSSEQRKTAEDLCALRFEVTRRKIMRACETAGRPRIAESLAQWGRPPHPAWIPEVGQSLARLQEGRLDGAIAQLGIAYALCGGGVPEAPNVDDLLLWKERWAAHGKDRRFMANLNALALEEARLQDETTGCAVGRGGGAKPYLIDFGGALTADRFPWPPQEPVPGNRSISGMSSILDESISLIGSVMPEMIAWLSFGMRGVLVFDVAEGQRFRSGSDFQLPGLIGLSSNCSPIQAAECLVHECAHQLMHMASMRIRFADPSCGEVHYSPVRGEHRPTVRVLLGAHAVATIARFYAALQKDPVWESFAAERLAYFSGWMREDYIPALDTSRALTAEGRQFWRELKAEL